MNIPPLNTCYKQGGQRWRVVCTIAGIITLRAGNGRRPDRIIHPSELKDYKRLDGEKDDFLIVPLGKRDPYT